MKNLTSMKWIALWLISLAPVASPLASDKIIKTAKRTVAVPSPLTLERAVDAFDDIPAIFDEYQPEVPWVPGVSLEIKKEVISRGRPAVVMLHLDGKAPFVSGGIHEKALVTASVMPFTCGRNYTTPTGKKILLDFKGSTRNVERRVDRIEIQVCGGRTSRGAAEVTAIGNLFEGYLPIDPDKNGTAESIAANAIQTAFIKQVEPMVDAVKAVWEKQN